MWFIFNYEQLDFKMGTVPGESLITLVSLIQLTKLGNSWHKKSPTIPDVMSEQVKMRPGIFYAAIIFTSDMVGLFHFSSVLIQYFILPGYSLLRLHQHLFLLRSER